VRHISEAENKKALRFVNKPSNKKLFHTTNLSLKVSRDLREGTGPEFFYAIPNSRNNHLQTIFMCIKIQFGS
jgi:hypothetical protein